VTRWLRRVVEVADRYGLIVETGRRGGHAKLVDPESGRRVSVSSSPRCPDEALRAVERDCRRLAGRTSL
jgi:predicted RNA binding protein YcfA (HicA-like mRNA interferase family)